MGTSQNQPHSIFENLSLAFTEYDGRDDWNERKVSKAQKLNRHARAFARSMKQMGDE